jgi:hypothetical protein
LLYPSHGTARQFNYAFFASGERLGGWEEFRRGSALADDRFGSAFRGSSKDSLTILYQPENQQCLWILRPQDRYIRNMPAITYESLPLSNLTRIQRTPLSDQYPSVDVFGKELPHTWCFYYQKAELARQYGDWQAVTDLWKEAKQANFLPGNGAELIVFIEGFANTQEWSTAADLTIAASKYGNNIRPALCDVWQDLKLNLPDSQEKQDAYQKVSEKLSCTSAGLN